jgi:tetratricopeptide (TPR) repeat protein
MVTKRGGKGAVTVDALTAMGTEVPEALQAVTLKAMATDRNKRYASVEMFAGDIERYQNGFATNAEEAGTLKRIKLWVGRNKVLAGSAVAMLVVVSSFSAKVVVEGRKASAALARLRASAPTFALRAADAMQGGNLEDALEAASNAVDLQPEVAEYHRIRGNVLQVMVRWPEAVKEYRLAKEDEQAQKNLKLTEELIQQTEKDTNDTKAKGRLFEELNAQGRQYEAMVLSKSLGDFWKNWKEGRKDPSVIPDLVGRLEAKLLPVPGTNSLMSKTEFTVGEWKLYIRAEGYPEWQQPDSKMFVQTDEHPVVKINWNQATKLCEWLSKVTGKEWGLPTNSEWDAAVGKIEYHWGDYYPPHWDDGNFSFLADGNEDRRQIGMDGIKGTAPVGSFKPNALGFYDLAGNAWEWIADQSGSKNGDRMLRGAGWETPTAGHDGSRTSNHWLFPPHSAWLNTGFRVIRR